MNTTTQELQDEITAHLDTLKPSPAYEQGFLAGVAWLLNNARNRTVFVDGVDFQHELGNTDNQVFSSLEHIIEDTPCAHECGVIKCLVVPLEWVHPQNLRYSENPKDKER